MRYFLKLAYNGAPFHGWQSQPNAVSMQQTLEESLSVMLRMSVPVVGAGRTDTGVNARVMFAHFDVPAEPQPAVAARLADKKRFLLSLNRLCGPDISILDLIEVDSEAHARFDATRRTYKYFISYEKSPFLYPLSWHSPRILDIDRMNEAAAILLDVDDFTSFAKLHSDSRTNICRIDRADWQPWMNSFETPGVVFTVAADRFLRNMVRALVGTLVEVGSGRLDTDGFKRIIDAKDRCSAGTSMPPQALYLWDVEYPFITS